MPPDLVGRDFTTAPDQVNTRWCGDITYIHTWQGWSYLATVIDLASRKVVGWTTADHLRTDLVAEALTNALASRRPTGPLLFTATAAVRAVHQRRLPAGRRRPPDPPLG